MTLAGSTTASSSVMASRIHSEALSPGFGAVNILSAAPYIVAAAGAGLLLGRRKAAARSGRSRPVTARKSTLKLTSS